MMNKTECAFSGGNYTLMMNVPNTDIDGVMRLLALSYWANDRPRQLVEKSLKGSLTYGVYLEGRMVGFMRFVTDYATFAYLCDVIVDPDHRGQGISKWMLRVALDHPELQGIRRICLMTRDAQGLYEPFGFEYLKEPRRYMEKVHLKVVVA